MAGQAGLGLLERGLLWSKLNERRLKGAVAWAEMPVLPWETTFPRGRDGPLALPEELGPFSQGLTWSGLSWALHRLGETRGLWGAFLSYLCFFLPLYLKTACVTLKLL